MSNVNNGVVSKENLKRGWKELSWKEKLLVISIGLGGIWLLPLASKKQDEKKKLREKIRCFKPTVTESAFSKSISWEMRDKPLSDEELDEFMKNQTVF